MTVRNVTPHTSTAWKGLNSFISKNNIDEQSWIDANNVLVNSKGEAEVLRSPKAFGNPINGSPGSSTGPHPFTTMDEYQRVAGNALFIDHDNETYYLLAAGGTPSPLLAVSSPAANFWTSLTINNTFQRINGSSFLQFMSDFSVFDNGIPAPTVAPVLSYVVNGADTQAVAVSLQGSYCYMNSVTGHVSQPSPLSNILGPIAAGHDVHFTYTASAGTPGVDTIVFFLTLDGGSVPFLVLNDLTGGDPLTAANATSATNINLSLTSPDTLTPEPVYNAVPLRTATFMFGWKDRIFLVVDGGLQYSGYESTYIGNPYESWPVLNQLNVPNRADRAVGGISTPAGALIFGQRDSYLMTGYPSDKVVGPNNAIAVTEHMEPLNWNIGIVYPKTAVNTPFGVIWTDQTKRIRLWNQQGIPAEVGQPLRTELDSMDGELKASWFQHGKNGGYYVISNGAKTLFMMVYLSASSGQTEIGFGKSNVLAPEAMASATFNGVERFFFGKDNQIWEILNPDLQGDGWDPTIEIFFKVVIGNAGGNTKFSSLHSMQVSGNFNDTTIAHSALDEVDPEAIVLTSDLEGDTGDTLYGMIDSDERRYHVILFSFGVDDRFYRNIDSFTINVRNAQRLI